MSLFPREVVERGGVLPFSLRDGFIVGEGKALAKGNVGRRGIAGYARS